MSINKSQKTISQEQLDEAAAAVHYAQGFDDYGVANEDEIADAQDIARAAFHAAGFSVEDKNVDGVVEDWRVVSSEQVESAAYKLDPAPWNDTMMVDLQRVHGETGSPAQKRKDRARANVREVFRAAGFVLAEDTGGTGSTGNTEDVNNNNNNGKGTI